MRFPFEYKLPSGAAVQVDAEVYIPKEDIILGLSFPHSSGLHLFGMLVEAAGLHDDMEAVAWDKALDLKARGEDVA